MFLCFFFCINLIVDKKRTNWPLKRVSAQVKIQFNSNSILSINIINSMERRGQQADLTARTQELAALLWLPSQPLQPAATPAESSSSVTACATTNDTGEE